MSEIILNNDRLLLLDNTQVFKPEPKIILNTEEFRTEALAFKEYGYYTKHPVTTISGQKYWKEMRRRCLEGHKNNRGDWISGYHYFYLNFSPIIKVESLTENTGMRIEGFPDFWDGDEIYYTYVDYAEKAGKHVVVLKCRRRGFSFKNSSMLNRNYFLIPNSISYAVASSKEYLFGDGIVTKAWRIMDFIDGSTAWSKRRQKKNTEDHRRASYIQTVNGVEVEKGYMSEIQALSLHDNIQKVRGKAGRLMLFEEAGSFNNLVDAWRIVLPSFQQGSKVFGQLIAFGTGGDESSDFMTLEDMFKNPKKYHILPCVNMWTKVKISDKPVGFFSPEYLNREGCMDRYGNSEIKKAKQEVEDYIESLIKDGAPNLEILKRRAEMAITPEDSMLKTTGTMFPVAELRVRLGEIESNLKLKATEYHGELVIKEDGKIDWELAKTTPIEEFPLVDTQNPSGSIVIWAHPAMDEDGATTRYRYIIGVDPYDDDGQIGSLASAFVMDTWTDKIVAEYTGRPQTAKEYYRNLKKLADYYGATIMYENNKKGLFQFFEHEKCLHRLADTPKSLKDQELIKFNTIGNKSKGVGATLQINRHARELYKGWLLSENQFDENKRLNLYTLRSKPLIQETIYWNPDPRANFDRISAIGMLMLYREEVIRYNQYEMESQKAIIKDDFLTRAWNRTKIALPNKDGLYEFNIGKRI